MITSASNRCKNCTGTCPTKKPRNKFLPESILFCADDARLMVNRIKETLADFDRDAIGYNEFPLYERKFVSYAKEMLNLARERLRGLVMLDDHDRKELGRAFKRMMDKGYFGPRDLARHGFYAATMPDAWYDLLASEHGALHKELKCSIDACLTVLADAEEHYNGSLTKAKKQKARLEPSFCF